MALLRTLLPRREASRLEAEIRDLYGLRVRQRGEAGARRWLRREVLAWATRRSTDTTRQLRRGVEGMMGAMIRDVRLALRRLARTPGFTAVALVTLALGIGATTFVYSVVDRVVLRSLPFPDADRLVAIWPNSWMTRGDLSVVQRDSRTLQAAGAFQSTDGFNLASDGGGLRVNGSRVSPELLELLRARPAAGRLFRPEESEPGRSRVVLLRYDFWQEHFGGDPQVVGRSIRLDGESHEVVGVLPEGWAFPSVADDLLVPVVMDRRPERLGEFWGYGGYRGVGRLAPGASRADAQAELRELAGTMREENVAWTPSEDFRADARVLSLHEATVGDVRPTLLALLGAVAVVLLVVCANVANLLLTRGMSRARDAAVRTALGAGRLRLVRENLVETLILAAGGCILGVALALLGLEGFQRWGAAQLPRSAELALDGRILAAAVTVSVLAGVLAGLLPALRNSGAEPGEALRSGGRGSGRGRRRARVSRLMVTAQVAAAVVLVAGAGLLTRTLAALDAVDPGFDVEGVVTARVNLTGAAYREPGPQLAFFETLRDRAEAIPGVTGSALSGAVPFGPQNEGVALFMEGITEDPNALPGFDVYRIGPHYLSTLGIPVLRGRGIEEGDRYGDVNVALVDATAAERFWPDGDPVGARVRYPWSSAPWLTIVGVVGSVSDDALSATPTPTLYTALPQNVSASGISVAATLTMRIDEADQTGPAVAALRGILRDMDPSIPLASVSEMEGLLARSHARTELTARLFGLFAGLALLLGCLGVYGVAAHGARERTREIGVRMALGADRGEIRGRILRDGLLLALPGVLLGIALAVPGARLLDGFLFGVEPLDPVTFVAVPLVLVAAVLVAVYLPARRATRVDPVKALRTE
jgi:predicted permease